MAYQLGLDRSGNNNNFTVSNMGIGDQMLDSPTNNFPTFNPIAYPTTHTTLSEGNLSVKDNGGNWSQAYVTQAITSGKIYVEFCMGNADNMFFGITSETTHNDAGISFNNSYVGSQANDFGFRIGDYGSGSGNNEGYSTGGSFTSLGTAQSVAEHIYQLAIDLDNAKLYFGKQNTWYNSGDPAAGSNGISISATEAYFVTVSIQNQNTNAMVLNAGQDSSFASIKTSQGNSDGNNEGDFFYSPPAGFLALCTKNLPEPTVDPKNHFNTVLWTGNATARSITGVGFKPDFLWIKNRAAAENHSIFDVVRGVDLRIFSDTNDADDDRGAFGLRTFDSDGFTIGTGGELNGNTQAIVAWCWKAGNANTAFSESGNNPAGTHRANVAAGFSIVSYTGTGAAGTVAHGLSAAPELMLIKNRDVADAWAVYYGDNTDYMVLDTNAATADAATYWNDTSPTSSVFTVNTAHSVNADGEKYIAYCWHSVKGFSKIGTYKGNNNASGPFVFTGFRPAFVLLKSISSNSWVIIDSKRDTHNQSLKRLYADSNEAEYTDTDDTIIDIVSNGFKHRLAGANANGDADTIVYLAFAETPIKYSNPR